MKLSSEDVVLQAIAAHGITILHFMPSMLREFLQTPRLEPCARCVR
jgi:hypothetical protein